MSDLKKVGRVGGKALLYFEIVSTIALAIGMVVVNLTKPGAGLDISMLAKGDVSKYAQAGEALVRNRPSHVSILAVCNRSCLACDSAARRGTGLQWPAGSSH